MRRPFGARFSYTNSLSIIDIKPCERSELSMMQGLALAGRGKGARSSLAFFGAPKEKLTPQARRSSAKPKSLKSIFESESILHPAYPGQGAPGTRGQENIQPPEGRRVRESQPSPFRTKMEWRSQLLAKTGSFPRFGHEPFFARLHLRRRMPTSIRFLRQTSPSILRRARAPMPIRGAPEALAPCVGAIDAGG